MLGLKLFDNIDQFLVRILIWVIIIC